MTNKVSNILRIVAHLIGIAGFIWFIVLCFQYGLWPVGILLTAILLTMSFLTISSFINKRKK